MRVIKNGTLGNFRWMLVKRVPVNATLNLRQLVLRPKLKPEECILPEDASEKAVHFGAYDEDKLIGVCSLYCQAEDSSDEEESKAWQLRMMATDPKRRCEGVGVGLLTEIERFVLSRNDEMIWCNARIGAVGFYRKFGYHTVGEEFFIPEIGLHFRMKKEF